MNAAADSDGLAGPCRTSIGDIDGEWWVVRWYEVGVRRGAAGTARRANEPNLNASYIYNTLVRPHSTADSNCCIVCRCCDSVNDKLVGVPHKSSCYKLSFTVRPQPQLQASRDVAWKLDRDATTLC